MEYYNNVIQYLQWQVMEIQMNGMLVDMDKATALRAHADAKYGEFKGWLEQSLGYKFNPNSPKQVYDVLTNDLGLAIPLKKSDTGMKETVDELSLLKATIPLPDALPVVKAILACRDVRKKSGTYLQPQPWRDGRVRSQFRCYGTLTWRLSSREPNLQNLPRGESHGINVKDIYVAPPGTSLVELDYSALEDRIPAYASNCTKLIAMFENGENTHLYRAGIIFGKPIPHKKGYEKEYDFSKRLRYARGYGAAPPKISDKLLEDTHEWHSPAEITPMLNRLDADMPEIMAFHNACWHDAEKSGVLWDGFGTPRLLYSRPSDRRQVAYSWPVQATASGIMNRSMVRIYHAKLSGLLDPSVKVVCQVHDSLVFEIPDYLVEVETKKIKSLMEEPVTVFGHTTKFPVEAKYGPSWGAMKEMRLAA